MFKELFRKTLNNLASMKKVEKVKEVEDVVEEPIEEPIEEAVAEVQLEEVVDSDHDSRIEKLIKHNEDITVKKMTNRVNETSYAIENLINNISYISKNVNKQMDYIENVIKQVDVYSGVAEEVAAGSVESSTIADETLAMAKEGQSAMDESIAAMKEIEDSVSYNKTVVQSLSQHSTKIDQILKVLKNITSQTNLLALNASIEAARAGEHGRGFSVVADEVRKLAVESDKSAEEISKVIKEINDSIEETTIAMDKSTSKVAEGVDIANNTNEVFNEIIESITATTEVAKEINQAMDEQSASLQEVIFSTEDLNKMSKGFISMIDVMLMNVHQTKNSLKYLSRTSEDLAALNSRMDKVINADEEYVIKTRMEGFEDLDPAMTFQVQSVRILDNIHGNLVEKDASNEMLPGVAKSWYVKEDNVTWIFSIRKGIKFHNGREITAEDVEYSLKRLLCPELKSPNAWFLYDIEGAKEFNEGKSNEVNGIKVLDQYRIGIKLTKPYIGFISNLAQTCCSILAKEDVENGKFTGCGAYILEEHNEDETILTAYKDYFGGQPYIDKINIAHQSEETIEKFLEDKYDFLLTTPKEVQKLEGDEGDFTIKTQNALSTQFWGFNFRQESIFAQNKDVRMAINHAIDRQRMINEFFFGIADECKGIFPPALLDNSELQGFEYDPSKSKTLLEESGYFDTNEKLRILSIAGAKDEIQEFIIESLEEVGIECEVIEVPKGKEMDTESIAKCDIYSLGWIADTGDPDNYLRPLFHPDIATNFGGYHNEEVIAFMEEAKAIINPQKRLEMYERIQDLIIEDVPWLFLYHTEDPYVYKNNIKNVKVSALQRMRFENILIQETIDNN